MKKIIFILAVTISQPVCPTIFDDAVNWADDTFVKPTNEKVERVTNVVNKTNSLISNAPNIVNEITNKATSVSGNVSNVVNIVQSPNINSNITRINQAIAKVTIPSFPSTFSFESFANGALTDFFSKIMKAYHNLHPALQGTMNLVSTACSALTESKSLSQNAGSIAYHASDLIRLANYSPINDALPTLGETSTRLLELHTKLQSTLPHTLEKLNKAAIDMQNGTRNLYAGLGKMLENTQKQIIILQKAVSSTNKSVPPPPAAPVPPPAPPAMTVRASGAVPPPPPLPA